MRACNQFTILLILVGGASCQLFLGSLLAKSWLTVPFISLVNKKIDEIESSTGLCIVMSYYIITLNTYCLPGTQLFAVFAGTKFGFYEAILLGSETREEF